MSMLTTVEGVFRDGRIELRETPENIREARVIVTFLAEERPSAPSAELGGEPHKEAPAAEEERVQALRALVDSLPATSKPSPPDRRMALGMDVGKVWIAEDFDAPLPDELQRAFEGEDGAP
jgi:hypothetical protein